MAIAPFTGKQLNEAIKVVADQYDVTQSWVRRHLACYCEEMLNRQLTFELPDTFERPDVEKAEGRGLEE